MMRRRWAIALGIVFVLVVVGLAARPLLFRVGVAVYQRVRGRATVEERIEQYGPAARQRFLPHFQKAGVAYPPAELILVGLKHEKRLEVYARSDPRATYRLICSYPVLAAGGELGPKLREGDRQVPEGIYRIESLNPNSLYHLSLRIDYPSAADREQAKRDGRTGVGGDIMIHGRSASVGCLAMGDPASEELFVMAAETGLDRIRVILSPVDFRTRELPPELVGQPTWMTRRYVDIRAALAELPRPRDRNTTIGRGRD